MISFQPSDKVGHSDPKNKYHAINSVYYIFSIQVYITFLSIQVHIIIHIVLLCLLGFISFILRCWLILGHNFIFFFQSVKHSCNMSTLLVDWGRGQWVQWWAGSSLMTGPSVLEVFHANAPLPHPVQTKSLRGRRGPLLLPPSCQLNVGLRSHCVSVSL